MTQIAIVDYGIGNVQSVVNACTRIGARTRKVNTGDQLVAEHDHAIIMPGVGAIGEALAKLRASGLESALRRRVVDEGIRFLGICVGMQVLGEICEEFGTHRGFGWIPGRVRRLAPPGSALRLPHVGWNTVEPVGESWMSAALGNRHFYFCHSYAVECPEHYVRGRSDYGAPFAAAVEHGNIYGVQFHPEMSSDSGEALLAGFLKKMDHA